MCNPNPQNSDVIVYVANLANFDEASLIADERLPEWVKKQAQALSGQRKIQFLACRLLLLKILKNHYQFEYLPLIEITTNGRPKFIDEDAPDFNISHSQSVIAVATSHLGKIGLDIELHRPRQHIDKVATNFFSSAESIWLNQQPDKLAAFWQLWTVRESALKLYAKGVWQMRQLDITPEPLSVAASFAPQINCIYQRLDNVHLSISSDIQMKRLEIMTI